VRDSSYFFILNPASGHPRDAGRWEAAIREACGVGALKFEIARTRIPGEARELAGAARKAGWGAVVAVGGDGTVNEVGSALAGTACALGILPKGSGNGLARELGFPRDPRAACRTLLACRQCWMDAGLCNGRYFFNVAGAGLDAEVAMEFNRKPRQGLGTLPYVYLTALHALRQKPVAARLLLDGRASQISYAMVTAANGRQFGAGALIAPDAVLDDGLLDLTIVEPFPIWNLLAYWPSLYSGRLAAAPFVRMEKARSLVLERPGPGPCQIDGEPIEGPARLEFSIAPKALKILTPQGYGRMARA